MSWKIDIRPMLQKDVVGVVQCFAQHYDVFDCPATVEAFLNLDPKAFFVATLDDKVIGVCDSPLGPQQTTFIGLYGIRVDYQGQGIGSRLFQKCLAYHSTRNIGHYAVPQMQKKYMNRSGFQVEESVSMINLVGVLDITFLNHYENTKVASLLPEFYQQVIEYDFKIHQ